MNTMLPPICIDKKIKFNMEERLRVGFKMEEVVANVP